MKEFGPGGGRVPGAPLRSTNDNINTISQLYCNKVSAFRAFKKYLYKYDLVTIIKI